MSTLGGEKKVDPLPLLLLLSLGKILSDIYNIKYNVSYSLWWCYMNLNCITLSVLTTNQNLDMQIYIWFLKKKKVVRRFKKHYKNRILWELFHGSGFTGLRLHIYPGIILCELNPMPWWKLHTLPNQSSTFSNSVTPFCTMGLHEQYPNTWDTHEDFDRL